MMQKIDAVIISGPSCVGKTTIAKKVKDILNLRKVVTSTTREKRDLEVHGEDYFFFTDSEFKNNIKNGSFVEYANIYGNYYGTLKSEIDKDKNTTPCLVLDLQGHRSFKSLYKNCLSFFVMPHSMESIVKRLKDNNQRSNVEERIYQIGNEMCFAGEYDYIIRNKTGEFNKTVDFIVNKISNVLRGEK